MGVGPRFAAAASARTQVTPLGVNRWVLLAIACFYTSVDTCMYLGWPSLAKYMFRSGAFSWYCAESSPGVYVSDMREQGYDFICEEQDLAVQCCFTVAMVSQELVSGVAGWMLDYCGPKVTGAIGEAAVALGWTLVACNIPSSWVIYFAFFLVGAASDMTFMPVLPISNLFPSSPGIICGLISAASCFSSFVPVILLKLVDSTKFDTNTLLICYVLMGPVLCCIISLLFFPMTGYQRAEDFLSSSMELVPYDKNIRENYMSNLDGNSNSDETLNAYASTDDASDEAYDSSSNNSIVGEDVVQPEHNGKCTINQSDSVDTLAESTCTNSRGSCGCKDCLSLISDMARSKCTFWEAAFSLEYALLVVFFSVHCLAFGFYISMSNRMFSKNVVNVLDFLIPMSAIPCVLFGRCADVFGASTVLCIINVFGVSAYLFVFPECTITQYVSVVNFALFQSFMDCETCVYIQSRFPSKYFGTLLGIGSTIAGLSSVFTSPLYNYAITGGVGATQNVMLSLTFALFTLFTILYYMKNSGCSRTCYNAATAV